MFSPKTFLISAAFFLCAMVHAQDFGFSGSWFTVMPVGDTSHVGAQPGFRVEGTIWNSDFGFPRLCTQSITYGQTFPVTIEKVAYLHNNLPSTGKINFSTRSFGVRYTTEAAQPTKHLAVHIGLGLYMTSILYTFKPEGVLSPGDYATDFLGHEYSYGNPSQKTFSGMFELTAGVSYEFRPFNIFVNAGFYRGLFSEMPFQNSIDLAAGIFVPVWRR
ncbi:MAG TPA: hypothetical protein VFU15_13740 [Bacteroidia bacterium]|nr:hypothetical protein [Bacteroidia bacterium]